MPENVEYRSVPLWVTYVARVGVAFLLAGAVIGVWNGIVGLLFPDVPTLGPPWTWIFPIGGVLFFGGAYLYSYHAHDAGGAYVTTKLGVLTLALIVMIGAVFVVEHSGVSKMKGIAAMAVAMGMALTVAIYDVVLGD